MGHVKPGVATAVAFIFASIFPSLLRLPTETRKLQLKLCKAMEEIAVPLLENTRKEMKGLGEKGKEKSIIGLLSALSSHFGVLIVNLRLIVMSQLRLRMLIRACRCLRRKLWPK